MKKLFIAIDTTDQKKAKRIIAQSQTNKIKVGYKFGSIFMNSKKGREFVSKLRNKIIFIDQKYHDTVQTMLSAVKALKDLKINYLTVHISSGLNALKAVKKKGMGAYYSSGSRPNQTAESWGKARMYSYILGGPTRKIDKHITDEYKVTFPHLKR